MQEREGQPPFYNIRDLERTRPMLVLVAVFTLAVVAFGRWQGVRSLIGLALSFAVIVGFVVPAILRDAALWQWPWSGRWRSCCSRCT